MGSVEWGHKPGRERKRAGWGEPAQSILTLWSEIQFQPGRGRMGKPQTGAFPASLVPVAFSLKIFLAPTKVLELFLHGES